MGCRKSTRLTKFEKLDWHDRLMHRADVVFTRVDGYGNEFRVFAAAKKTVGWEQWGAPASVLAENSPAVDDWFSGREPVIPGGGEEDALLYGPCPA